MPTEDQLKRLEVLAVAMEQAGTYMETLHTRLKVPSHQRGLDGNRYFVFAEELRRTTAQLSQENRALSELAQHRNWELSYGYPDEEDEGEWQVHRVNGGVNDREWTLIGRGATPAAALDQALLTTRARSI